MKTRTFVWVFLLKKLFMYRYLILIIVVAIFSCKQNKSDLKENIIKWENGNIKRKSYTSNNLIQDTMWDYYSSGELSKICSRAQ